MSLQRTELASLVDHTLLTPTATRQDVTRVASEAVEWGCASVCVQPEQVTHAVGVVSDRLSVCSVVGFPHGASLPGTKASEAAAAVAHGAREIDVVAALGPIAEGDFDHLRFEIATVRAAVPDVVLKVIVESALWSPKVLEAACVALVDAGADFVKTSTGFHPEGGASVTAVATMREAVGTRCGVKASGGIRTLADCLAMIEAGADRLGLSATAAILAELS